MLLKVHRYLHVRVCILNEHFPVLHGAEIFYPKLESMMREYFNENNVKCVK